MTENQFLNNKYDKLKGCIRKTYSGWKALDGILRLSNISSENELVDWMVMKTLNALFDPDDMDEEELAYWLDELIVTKFQRKIRDGSNLIVATNIFSHFLRFTEHHPTFLPKKTVAVAGAVARTSTPVSNNSGPEMNDVYFSDGMAMLDDPEPMLAMVYKNYTL